MRIIFIRHGRTQSNVNHLLDTAFPGAPLDEVGLEQAASLPEKLAHEPIEIVMTSDIIRARQTGEVLAAALGVPLFIHPGVREIFAGDWELDPEWVEYTKIRCSWVTDTSLSMPHGDDGVTFFKRFDDAVAELQEYSCAAVVSHEGALNTWLTSRGDIPIDPYWRIPNTGFVVVEGEPAAWKILSWPDREIP